MKRPRKRYPQGTRTAGSLEFEVTLKFKIRPAGFAGNDGWGFARVFHMLLDLIGLLRYVQFGDETAEIGQVRWRRPGETWQRWDRKRWVS